MEGHDIKGNLTAVFNEIDDIEGKITAFFNEIDYLVIEVAWHKFPDVA
jgi:hypothetical protein